MCDFGIYSFVKRPKHHLGPLDLREIQIWDVGYDE